MSWVSPSTIGHATWLLAQLAEGGLAALLLAVLQLARADAPAASATIAASSSNEACARVAGGGQRLCAALGPHGRP